MRISRRSFLLCLVLAAPIAGTPRAAAQGGDGLLAASLVIDNAASAAGFTALAVSGPESNYATPYTFTTLAGIATLAGTVNGTGTAAAFNAPSGVAVDSSENIYVADTGNSVIRKITSAGVVTTLAGNASVGPGSRDGTGAAAEFSLPYGVAVDASDNVYVADSGNSTIRKITSAGVVTTLAGTAGLAGATNGLGTAARFNFPQGVAVDASGNVYVADSDNNVIRKIAVGGMVTTLAGTAGLAGATNGTGAAARFNAPQDVAVDVVGNLYVADTGNNTIREITAAGVVTTLAGLAGVTGGADGTGTAAQFNSPQGLAVDTSGNVYVADAFNDVIRKITAGTVTTIAGTVGITGILDGKGPAALFDGPSGVAVDGSGTVYVADTENDTIRRGSLQIISIGVGTAPTITTQPKSTTVILGAGFSFSVVATGSAPLTYQWLLNGAAISGATGATYAPSSSVSAEAGSYTVVVSNSAGSVTSSAATLTFGTPPPPAPDHAGGGAPSLWFDGALALLVGARLASRWRTRFRAAG